MSRDPNVAFFLQIRKVAPRELDIEKGGLFLKVLKLYNAKVEVLLDTVLNLGSPTFSSPERLAQVSTIRVGIVLILGEYRLYAFHSKKTIQEARQDSKNLEKFSIPHQAL